MDLPQLKAATTALTAQAFHPGTSTNHAQMLSSLFVTITPRPHDPRPLHPLRLYRPLNIHFHFIKKLQELCLRGQVSTQAVRPRPTVTQQFPGVITSESCGPDHDDTTSLAPPHLPTPSHAVVAAVIKPGIPRTTHEGLRYLQVSGDAQAEQPCSPLCQDLRPHQAYVQR